MSRVKITTVQHTAEYQRAVHEAAELHAKANSSDPFAKARITLYMNTLGPNGGYAPSAVREDAERVLAAQQAGKQWVALTKEQEDLFRHDKEKT